MPNSTEMPGAGTGSTMGNARISSHVPMERAPRKSAMSASETRSLAVVRACSAKSADRLRASFCSGSGKRRSASMKTVPENGADESYKISYR